MKNEDYQELRALCGVAGKEAQHLQPEASVARDAAARSRRKLFWKILGGTSSAVITIAVFAVVSSEPAPSLAQTSGPSLAPPPPVASPLCERLDCTPTASDQSASSPAAPVVVEHLTPSVASISPALPETAQPESRAASPAPTQAEKELAESQPDGSC
jgi:hypothetical protein